ncbi:MAG: NAD(P)-binding protein [Rhodobacteraceae bacterium]|nr:NAD(P)-binding protein [Paracoccaceae bacterium]
MSRDPYYDILFEPIQIGPVTTKNRFFQVPHCTGLGYRDPSANAWLRGIKAQGGWGTVCTEQVEIHHTSDITPFIELRIWDDRDVPMLAQMAEKIHEHDALAGIELAYNGLNGPNLYGREVPMAPTGMPVESFTYDPVSAKTMDKQDIRNLRKWHRDAAIRGKNAGYDLVYVYAGHGLGFFHHFISKRYNRRSDEYGGNLENRVRILKEIIIDTKEAVGDKCAVPCRITINELMGKAGLETEEAMDIVSSLAELPDLWDFCLAGWENDSQTSRFSQEGFQDEYRKGFKALTTKPVVGVGRYTSPDKMVSLIKSGEIDLIGCARPSIADPFLPRKIEEGRVEDIRECIGCNICVSGDFTMSPIRCTQNPSMGEEWRKGWHPEYIKKKVSSKPVLIVGGGPAGLEAAQMLGKRGYDVTLAERELNLGGRVFKESKLPGLAAWGRVVDYRLSQFNKLPNVETYLDSDLTPDHLLEFGIPLIGICTGSTWHNNGLGFNLKEPLDIDPSTSVYTPDDIMAGNLPKGNHVLIWDDDHYYMGNVLAELLIQRGYEVSYTTPAPEVATWTQNTMEQHRIQKQIMELGVTINSSLILACIEEGIAKFNCSYTGREQNFEMDSILLVTSRYPNDSLFRGIRERESEWKDHGLEMVKSFGDCEAPATIAHAVYAGRRFAEELEAKPPQEEIVPFRREIAELQCVTN